MKAYLLDETWGVVLPTHLFLLDLYVVFAKYFTSVSFFVFSDHRHGVVHVHLRSFRECMWSRWTFVGRHNFAQTVQQEELCEVCLNDVRVEHLRVFRRRVMAPVEHCHELVGAHCER